MSVSPRLDRYYVQYKNKLNRIHGRLLVRFSQGMPIDMHAAQVGESEIAVIQKMRAEKQTSVLILYSVRRWKVRGLKVLAGPDRTGPYKRSVAGRNRGSWQMGGDAEQLAEINIGR